LGTPDDFRYLNKGCTRYWKGKVLVRVGAA
jgi:hypothetical protein